ncbi:TR112 protein, partial [Poecile atricapillus]|nr:TR112 protein [Poecile atricapillus]
MKLLTHNLLSSHVPGLRPGGGFPLRIELGRPSELPPEPLPNSESDEEFLRRVHHVLLEVEVLEGSLQCPDSGRRFPISKGVPNLLLSEDEA